MQVNVPLPVKYLGVDYAAGAQTITDSIALELILLGLATRVTPLPFGWDKGGLAANLAAIGVTTKTIWASGALFWIPAGDGGANGLLFSGGGTGNFTLSAAVVSGFTIPQGWVYLTANAGGLSNPAGWYYFTMSDDTNGKIYTTTYDSTSGLLPVFPASPVEMAFTSATRLTSTTSEIQSFQVPIDYATQMGINGSLQISFSGYGNTAASAKSQKIRAGANLLYQCDQTTSPQIDFIVEITAQGSLTRQITTRSHGSIGGQGASISAPLKAVNLGSETTLNVSLKTTATTDHLACLVRKITATYGG